MVTIYVFQDGQWKEYLSLKQDSFLCTWIVTEAAISHIAFRILPCVS